MTKAQRAIFFSSTKNNLHTCNQLERNKKVLANRPRLIAIGEEKNSRCIPYLLCLKIRIL